MLIIAAILSIYSNVISINAKNSNMYAKTTVNIRDKPNLKSKIVGQVYWDDKVKVIRKVNKKWGAIRYKGKICYISLKYLKKNRSKYQTYPSPSSNSFKSYEDADCITNNVNIIQGKLKKKYHLDYSSGVYMVGNRYCIAIGSYYTKEIGVKIDLVLSPQGGRKHTLKCITADSKSDRDTVNQHRVHKTGNIVEFVVNTTYLPKMARKRGDISYAGKQFKGKIKTIKVYK